MDPKNKELINDLIHGMGMVGSGKGIERAEKIINKQILKGEKVANLEALDLQDLDFMRQIVWDTLEELSLNRNMICNIDCLFLFTNI